MKYINYEYFKQYKNYTAKQFLSETKLSTFILELGNLSFEIDWDYCTRCFYIVKGNDSDFLCYDDKLYNKNFKEMSGIIKEIEKRLKKSKKDIQEALNTLKDK